VDIRISKILIASLACLGYGYINGTAKTISVGEYNMYLILTIQEKTVIYFKSLEERALRPKKKKNEKVCRDTRW